MIDNLLIAVHAFARCMLTSFSIDEILLLRYMDLSTNLRALPLRVEMVPSHLKCILCFICIYVEANASYCLLPAMQ